MVIISLGRGYQFKLFGFQSLKAAVVSVAAGLRHSLAVTGKKNKQTNNNIGECFHQALNPSLHQALNPSLFIVSCFQTQAVCISGAAVS